MEIQSMYNRKYHQLATALDYISDINADNTTRRDSFDDVIALILRDLASITGSSIDWCHFPNGRNTLTAADLVSSSLTITTDRYWTVATPGSHSRGLPNVPHCSCQKYSFKLLIGIDSEALTNIPEHEHGMSLIKHKNMNMNMNMTNSFLDMNFLNNLFRTGCIMFEGTNKHGPIILPDGPITLRNHVQMDIAGPKGQPKIIGLMNQPQLTGYRHTCLDNRSICIMVQRASKYNNDSTVDLAASSNVQDAFVIAVEQQARERLERLSALKKIKPVDMTKLSSQAVNESTSSSIGETGQTSPGHLPGHPTILNKEQQPKTQDKDKVNGVSDSSSVYVTSVPNLNQEHLTQEPQQHLTQEPQHPRSGRSRSRSSTPNQSSPSPRRGGRRSGRTSPLTPSPRREAPTLAGRDTSIPLEERPKPRKRSEHKGLTNGNLNGNSLDNEHEANKSGDELELTHDLNDTLEDTEDLENDQQEASRTESEDKLDYEGLSESGDSLPGTPEKAYGVAGLVISSPSRERQREQDSPRSRTPLDALSSQDSTSSRKSGGSSGSGSVGGGTPRHKTGGGSTPRHSRKKRQHTATPDSALITTPDKTYDNMINMVEFDPGHREMAVDVPDSFVARTKTPPRYPPPKPLSGSITPIHNNNNNNNSGKSSKKGGSGQTTPLNGTLPKPTPAPRVPEAQQIFTQEMDTSAPEEFTQTPATEDENQRIKKYEEELKQRREREEHEMMLRSSLRSSQKLQALASGHPGPKASGVVNEAFNQEQDEVHLPQPSSETPSINELIQSLQRIQTVLKSNGHRISEDMTLVAQLLTNPEFQKVLAVHNKVQETWCLNRPPTPVTDQAQELLAEVLRVLQESTSPESAELIGILSKYCMEGLMYAQDRIAEREPVMPTGDVLPEEESVIDRVSHYPEDQVKIVRIDKTNEPLGATIRNESDSVIIGRIVKGGAAEKSGLLNEGDEILEVNGVEVRGKSVNDVCDMLAGMTGTLTFIIIPGGSVMPTSQPVRSPSQTMHMKAHFDYDPEEDLYIPCRELGMSFQKGDILHVISQADQNWWQAYRDGEEDQTLAGLIPSKSFQQQREAMRQTVVGDNNNKEKTKKGKLLCAKKHQKKKKKKMLYPNYNEDFDSEEILTYEEVALYYPRANRKRPIVLIGPPNIGRHELRQKLMADRERFAAAIPHTSRTRRDHEVDGQDYHFISRTQFESDILARKFVEHGEYEKAYYGTSLAAIRAVVNSGKICVLNLHPLSLKILKNSDLKPFVVFVAPPSLEKLRQKKQKLGEPVKEEELKETIEKAREMEEQYGHYFDLIIINQDVDRAYNQYLHEINMLEREPQWVPAAWLAQDQL
ncbi:unnamed protein product, partial [Meganyctiphanes norvegica]